MAIVQRKLKNKRVVYWVKFTWEGKDVWERAGTNRREAEALEKERKKQVADKTYRRERKAGTSVANWFGEWLSKRTNRTRENDEALLERHVLSVEWFAKMQMRDLRQRHLVDLVAAMRSAGRLGEKSIATVMGLVTTALARAYLDEAIFEQLSLPRGTVKKKTAPGNKRKPYRRDEVRQILSCNALRPDVRVWLALAFFTGMREGEICGRRWKDWDRSPRPLSALLVSTQYDDQPLKGDDRDMTRPRMVPVHPELEEILRAWWSSSYELVYCRKPTLDDFIVPQLDGANHTKSSGYKLFRRALETAGVANRSLHSTRHTFISVARSNGAKVDVLERVTHNASGALADPHGTIDDYTEFEWRPLCEAVARVDYDVDPIANRAVFAAPEPGLEPGGARRKLAERNGSDRNEAATGAPLIPAEGALDEAWFDASHRRLIKFGEVDPEGARVGLAVYRGLTAARAGDAAALEAALEDGGAALDGLAAGAGR